LLQAFCDDAKSERFGLCRGFVGGPAIAQDAGKLWNLSDPAAIRKQALALLRTDQTDPKREPCPV